MPSLVPIMLSIRVLFEGFASISRFCVAINFMSSSRNQDLLVTQRCGSPPDSSEIVSRNPQFVASGLDCSCRDLPSALPNSSSSPLSLCSRLFVDTNARARDLWAACHKVVMGYASSWNLRASKNLFTSYCSMTRRKPRYWRFDSASVTLLAHASL